MSGGLDDMDTVYRFYRVQHRVELEISSPGRHALNLIFITTTTKRDWFSVPTNTLLVFLHE